MSLFGPHAALPDREGRCAKLSEGDRPSVPRNGNRGFGGRTGREACRAFALTRTWDRSALQFISTFAGRSATRLSRYHKLAQLNVSVA